MKELIFYLTRVFIFLIAMVIILAGILIISFFSNRLVGVMVCFTVWFLVAPIASRLVDKLCRKLSC